MNLGQVLCGPSWHGPSWFWAELSVIPYKSMCTYKVLYDTFCNIFACYIIFT